ncbi:MAG: YkgJ family cysteine cluster protein [Methanosarcinales archaeon]|nr:YkgJ family cysteine cluster protein [Methanosarcinales archaeon]
MMKTVESAGFSCLMCGKCCERAEDDNSVYLLPEEIESIETLGFLRENFILPLLPDFYETNDGTAVFNESLFMDMLSSLSEQTDEEGRIHTFGWMLQRNQDGSCIFLNSESKKCVIYAVRPALCRTYPFFMSETCVWKCDCEGLGSIEKTKTDLSIELTKALQERALSDYADYIQTSAAVKEFYDKVQFNNKTGRVRFEENLKKNLVTFVIYDSTGVYAAECRIF